MSGPLGAPAPPAVGPLGPRPSPAPGPPPAASASPSGRASVPVSRPSPHPHPYPHPGAVPPLPNQWGPDPALPLDLPDRRRNPNGRNPNGRGTSGRRGRPGDAPRPPLWLTVVGVVAVAVLAGVCAAGGYIMFTHPDAPSSTAATPSAQPKPRDISSRQADPAPLTEAEAFPAATVGPGGYQVLKTQAGDCAGVAVGEPGKVLGTAGCNQAVRATLVSPDKVYVVTAGLLNLASATAAQQANDALTAAVGAQKGRFTGFDAGGVSAVFAKAATQLGWDVRGHFLGYAVVARADGQPLADTDQAARQVIDDLVEKYLLGTVVQARVSPKPASAAPSHR